MAGPLFGWQLIMGGAQIMFINRQGDSPLSLAYRYNRPTLLCFWNKNQVIPSLEAYPGWAVGENLRGSIL